MIRLGRRASLVIVLLALAGCGTGIVLLVNERTGTLVECRENYFDGIQNTLDRCVKAYEQAGFVVKSRQ